MGPRRGYLYYPDGTEGLGARYVHRAESPSNNKFFRIWGGTHTNDDYRSHSKVGLSTIADGGGKNIMEYTREAWDNGTGVGNSPAAVAWGRSSDLGRRIAVRMHFKFVSGQGAEDGVMQLWKDGALVMDFQNMDQKWGPADPSDPGHTTWNAGYLLGWATTLASSFPSRAAAQVAGAAVAERSSAFYSAGTNGRWPGMISVAAGSAPRCNPVLCGCDSGC